MRREIFPWFYYVPTDLNIVDGFSRGEDFRVYPYGRPVQWRPPVLPPGWVFRPADPN